MKRRFLINIFILFSVCVTAQENDYLGIYIRTSKEMKNVPPSTIIDRKGNVTLPGWEKPSISLYIKDNISQTYTQNRQPEFFFFFPDESDTNPVSVSKVVKTMKNYPLIYTKSPNDFLLIRLFKIKNRRAYRLEKEKALSTDNTYKVMDIDTIPFTSIPMSKHSYKVILDSKLPVGEYGFICKGTTPYKEIVYDFSIEE